MQKWNSNVPELEADKQKEKKRREYFLILSADISSVQLLLFATTLFYGVFSHHT